MHLTTSTVLSSVAPPAETNPIAAAIGTANAAARSDHVHAIAAPATPTTQAFGDAAAQGAGVGFATDTHKHGIPSTWTKVAAGTLGAVASLDLASLTGYRRYHLIITARRGVGDGGGTATIKLNNAAGHTAGRLHLTGTTVTGVQQVTAATASVGVFLTSASACAWLLDILAVHDDAASSTTAFKAESATVAVAGAAHSDWTHGVEETAVNSITEILTAFGVTLVAGHYVLYGSNETA